jgi:hypothetical protein
MLRELLCILVCKKLVVKIIVPWQHSFGRYSTIKVDYMNS